MKALNKRPKQGSAFFDNYKAALLIFSVAALLFSSISHAQLQPGQRQRILNKGYEWFEGKFRQVLNPPQDTLPLPCSDSNSIASKNKVLYMWKCSGGCQCKWDSIGTGGGVDTAVGIGVDITRINESKVLYEHKEIMFPGTQDLRAWTVPVTENYIYKVVVDDTMTREFKYDPNDVLSADNGITVIVNSLGHRFKLETTVFNAAQFGAKGDWNYTAQTGTDNTAAVRKMFSMLNGSKNLVNVKMHFGAGAFRITDTLATPNSAGWFTLEGEGMGTTQLVYDGVASGKDFLTLLNCQHATIQDIEFVGRTGVHGQPRAMINLRTENNIIGFSGMVADVVIQRVMMRGNIGAYDYGIRWTCQPGFDQNNEQTIIRDCFIELGEIYALSNEHYNSLWHKVYSSRFSAKRAAINIGKKNASGVDSSGGSFEFYDCTIMALGFGDTCIRMGGGGAIRMYDCKSEGATKSLLYARKSAEGSPFAFSSIGGTWTMGPLNGAAGEYHINASGGTVLLDHAQLSPDNLIKIRFTDSTDQYYMRINGCVNIDTIWTSGHIVIDNPCYTGYYATTTSISTARPVRVWLNGSGSFHRISPYGNFREITSTNPVIDVSGEKIISLRPATPFTVTNFIQRGEFDEITIVTNGNVTIANNANISTGTGADLPLPSGAVLKFIKSPVAFGGTWTISGGLGYIQNGVTVNNGVAEFGGNLIKHTTVTNNGFFYRVSDQLLIGSNVIYSPSLLQLWKVGGFGEAVFGNNDNNSNYFRHLFVKQKGSSYALNDGDVIGELSFNTVAAIKAVANSSTTGGFSGIDINIPTTTNAGASRPNAFWFLGDGAFMIGTRTRIGSELFRNTGTSSLGGIATYEADYSGSYTSRSLVDKAYVDAAVGGGGGTNLVIINDADYTVAAGVTDIVFKTLTTGRTLTLPTAASSVNRPIYIANGGNGAFNITTSISLRENASTTTTTIGQGQKIKIVSDGTDWWILQMN